MPLHSHAKALPGAVHRPRRASLSLLSMDADASRYSPRMRTASGGNSCSPASVLMVARPRCPGPQIHQQQAASRWATPPQLGDPAAAPCRSTRPTRGPADLRRPAAYWQQPPRRPHGQHGGRQLLDQRFVGRIHTELAQCRTLNIHRHGTEHARSTGAAVDGDARERRLKHRRTAHDVTRPLDAHLAGKAQARRRRRARERVHHAHRRHNGRPWKHAYSRPGARPAKTSTTPRPRSKRTSPRTHPRDPRRARRQARCRRLQHSSQSSTYAPIRPRYGPRGPRAP